MDNKNKKKTGHTVLTYRVRLYDRHFAWLEATTKLYRKVVQHFFKVLEQDMTLLEQSDFVLLRIIEEKCIGTKEMKAAGVTAEYPLEDFPKIPLYFRRSAINAAIDLVRKKAGRVQPEIVIYKGMYRNFTDKTIELKLYTGSSWEWVTYPFAGREFPTDAVRLSPKLSIKKKSAWLDVPVTFEVSDIRTVKERMQTEEKICALSFPDNDVMAVAVIMSQDGKETEHCFFRGGAKKEALRQQILERIRISEESRGREQKRDGAGKESEAKENKLLYAGLKELNQYYVHSISRQILNYCKEKNISIIVVPNYERSIDFKDKHYLKTDAYRWLGRSIISKLKYKAFQNGIVVTSIRPYHISDCCSECGAKIRKYNDGHVAGTNYHGGKLFLCPNGHKGNSARNTAINVGKQFLAFYKKES